MPEADMVDMKGLGVGIRDIVQNIKTIVFAFISGLWIGFLPGMGSGISNMVAYGYAKSISKDPESFGKGNPAGVWASETANNASLGGALIPMMALGIPGDGITAMLIAGLTIHRADHWETLVPIHIEGSLPLPLHGNPGYLLHRGIRDIQYHV